MVGVICGNGDDISADSGGDGDDSSADSIVVVGVGGGNGNRRVGAGGGGSDGKENNEVAGSVTKVMNCGAG